MKEILKHLKKLDSIFHIDNYFPNYINKFIFRLAFLLIIGQFIFIAYNDDLSFKQHAYIECQTHINCLNPFYYCQNQTNIFINYQNIDCEEYNKVGCVDGVCSKEVLTQGEILGKKPSKLYNRFPSDVFIILIISFLLNHLLYLLRYKK